MTTMEDEISRLKELRDRATRAGFHRTDPDLITALDNKIRGFEDGKRVVDDFNRLR